MSPLVNVLMNLGKRYLLHPAQILTLHCVLGSPACVVKMVQNPRLWPIHGTWYIYFMYGYGYDRRRHQSCCFILMAITVCALSNLPLSATRFASKLERGYHKFGYVIEQAKVFNQQNTSMFMYEHLHLIKHQASGHKQNG
jgi:hypothetical protein